MKLQQIAACETALRAYFVGMNGCLSLQTFIFFYLFIYLYIIQLLLDELFVLFYLFI